MKPAAPVISTFIGSVALEEVAGVYFGRDVVKAVVVAVGYHGVAQGLEFVDIVYNFGPEEGCVVVERRFVYYYFRAFGLDAFHHALNGRLAEVVAVRFHR